MDGSTLPDAPPDGSRGQTGDGDPPSWSLRRLIGRAFPGLLPDDAPATDAASPAGPQPAEERAMLVNVIRMREQRVEDVMIPRADIVAAPETATLDELIAVFRENQLTRVPVYRETLDDPVGFVHLKDIALAHGFDGPEGREGFEMARRLRPLLYVPPSMSTAKLLRKMQGSRHHIALVIDEYGGVDGLVTIEDLIEEIVGEIEDEHDDADPAPWREEAPGVWLVEARAPIEEFAAVTGADLSAEGAEEADTVGGLVFGLTDRVPEPGEVVEHPAGHRFEVVEADPRLIRRLRVRLAERDAA